MKLQETIREILTEEITRKYNKPSDNLTQQIIKYLNKHFKDAKRIITPKSRNYGNISEDLCLNNITLISSYFDFDNNQFTTGRLYISKELVKKISNSLIVRTSYIINIIEEWYEEFMLPELENKTGESGLYLNDEPVLIKNEECIPEPVLPENISDEEMIKFIVDNTLYTKDEIIKKLESGEEDLTELYLHILDIQNRKKIRGI